MAGVSLPVQGIQGRSLTALVAGRDAGWKDCAFAERDSSMIRTPQYKVIKNSAKGARKGGGEYELYEMIRDPLETTNLSTDPAHAAILKNLAARLEAWQKDIPTVPVIAGVAPEPKSGVLPGVERKKKARTKKQKAQE